MNLNLPTTRPSRPLVATATTIDDRIKHISYQRDWDLLSIFEAKKKCNEYSAWSCLKKTRVYRRRKKNTTIVLCKRCIFLFKRTSTRSFSIESYSFVIENGQGRGGWGGGRGDTDFRSGFVLYYY